MILIKEIDKDQLNEYDKIEFGYTSNKKYEIKKIDRGLGGFLLELVDTKPYIKKFNETTSMWKEHFDISKWKFFIAYDNDLPVGGSILAIIKDQIGGSEHSILWDLRVIEEYRYKGIGQKLFNEVKKAAKDFGDKELKIECQNTNYPAINFYYKQGAILRCINEHAYIDFPNEVQMIWYLDL